jgi:ribonucleotide monophosphatase NagD (HAD superfamily)
MFPLLQACQGEDLRIFVFGNGDDDEEYVASCSSAVMVQSPREAHLVLARGTFTIGATKYESAEDAMRHVDAALLECCEAGLPMLVANPDFHRPDASKSPMPGQIAARYAKMSGAGLIQQVGKPFPLVFEEGLASIGGGGSSAAQGREKKRKAKSTNRVCMIGDSIEHDVLGAHRFGIDSVWIQNGVHSSDLGTREGTHAPAKPAALRSFLSLHSDYPPSFILPSLYWAGPSGASLDDKASLAVGNAAAKQATKQTTATGGRGDRGEGEEGEEEGEGSRPARDKLERSDAFRAFLLEVESSMKRDTFVSILLRQPQQPTDKAPPGPGPPVLRSVSGRVVSLKAGLHCQLTLKYSTNDQAKNHELGAASARAIGALIAAHGFKKAQLVTTTKTFDLTSNLAAGSSRLTEAEVATDKLAVDAMAHDRQTSRPVDPSALFLRRLGVTTDSGRPLTGMADKLRQIERFVEVLAGLVDTSHELHARRLMAAPNPFLPAAAPPSLRVVDMGSGLAYLTFASHVYFRQHFSASVQTVGVEARPQLVQRCLQLARDLGGEFDGLSFLQGTIDEFFSPSPSPDESGAAKAAGPGAGAGARARAAQGVADQVLASSSPSPSPPPPRRPASRAQDGDARHGGAEPAL